MTPTADHARHRLRLTEVELAALCFVAAPGAAPVGAEADSAWEALDASGFAEDRTLPGWIGELGEVAAAPALHLVVEIFAAGSPEVHLWATPARTVVSSVADDGRYELRPLESVMIPYELARLVGLGPRPVPPGDRAIRVPAPALEAADAAADEPDHLMARRILTDAGLGEEEAAVIAALSASRRTSWRVTSIWAASPTELASSNLVVLDGGEAGLWFSDAEQEGDPETTLTLRPTRPSEVWQRLLSLLPSSGRPKGVQAHG